MTRLGDQIKVAARDFGFDVVGITSAQQLASDDQAFRDWLERGFAAGMEYMTRRPELHAHPTKLVPYAASIITLAVNYYATDAPFAHESRYGRVARYAWGRDYHDVIRPRLETLARRIETLAGRELRYRCFVDAAPLLERAVAARAGLGFFGKNTNLLQAGRGSWFFLAEILVDLDLPTEVSSVKVSCGTCTRCLVACPTAAFAGAYQLDSRRCISYLTIENKGEIPRELREGLGEWVFGCDVCQDVCPFNRFSVDTAWPELEPTEGTGPRLDLDELLSIASDVEFRKRFSGTPLLRPKRSGLLRNAAVVAANVSCTRVIPRLIERLEHDPEPLIRAHALWALGRLDPQAAYHRAQRIRRSDPDPLVRQEADMICEEHSSGYEPGLQIHHQ
jgi:epoxyqueuosine reductase